jgi:hypothetical protein
MDEAENLASGACVGLGRSLGGEEIAVIGSSPSSPSSENHRTLPLTTLMTLILTDQQHQRYQCHQWYGFPSGDSPLFLPCSSPVRSLLRIDSVREKGSRKARGIEVLHVWSIQTLAFSPVFFPVSRGAAGRSP